MAPVAGWALRILGCCLYYPNSEGSGHNLPMAGQDPLPLFLFWSISEAYD